MATSDIFQRGGLRWALAVAFVVAAGSAVAAQVWNQRHATDAVSAILGDDPGALGRGLFEAPTGLGVRLNSTQRSALNGRIASRPLDATAFALAALDATAQGNRTQAAKLVAHALALDPRTRLAWLWTLDDQARRNNNLAAANAVLRLLAVDPGQYPVYITILATLSKDPRNIPQIAAALRGNPGWRGPFLGVLEAGGFDPAIRYALMDKGSAKVLTQDSEQVSFVSDLIAKGDYERAYLAWVSYLPDSALTGVDTPYDAKFVGLPGPAPFNWQFSTEAGDRADPGANGLDLSYSGRKPTNLASQVIVLQPGTYRLRSVLTNAASEGGPGGGTTLTWQAMCLPGNRPIGALALDIATTGKQQLSPAFHVPDTGCPAIMLVLAGAASEFPVRLNAKIATVHLDRVADGTMISAPVPAPSSSISSSIPSVLP